MYKNNLRKLVEKAHSAPRFKDVDIIVMTPPVPDEKRMRRLLLAKTVMDTLTGKKEGNIILQDHRRVEDMVQYADAAREVVNELGDPSVVLGDLWTAMKNKKLSNLQVDGLHFSKDGYKVSLAICHMYALTLISYSSFMTW